MKLDKKLERLKGVVVTRADREAFVARLHKEKPEAVEAISSVSARAIDRDIETAALLLAEMLGGEARAPKGAGDAASAYDRAVTEAARVRLRGLLVTDAALAGDVAAAQALPFVTVELSSAKIAAAQALIEELEARASAEREREAEAAQAYANEVGEIERQIKELEARRDALTQAVVSAREARRDALRHVGDARIYIDELRAEIGRVLGPAARADRARIFLREQVREQAAR
jgi:hypothetical protein